MIKKHLEVLRIKINAISQREEVIVNFIVEQGSITNEQIQSLLNVKKTLMYAIVKKWLRKE